MAYIYCADIYCDDCGEAIKKRLTAESKAPADPANEWSYDSDYFPKIAGDDEESDTPEHCACGEHCVNAIEIWGGKVGLLFGELTLDGITYVEEAIEEANWGSSSNSWGREVAELWYRHYSDRGYQFKVSPNWI